MKEVMFVIRINMMNQTKRALSEAGISSFTATANVLGRGKGQVDFSIMNAAKDGSEEALSRLGDGPRLVSKRLATVVVPDEMVPRVVETVMNVNKTGKQGDGKIFVLPVENAYRVRTGELGEGVLDMM